MEMEIKVRPAGPEEYTQVMEFYDRVTDEMEGREYHPAWQKGVYPDPAFIRRSAQEGTLYVLEADGIIAGAMVMNHETAEGYDRVPWQVEARPEEVAVLHALGVLPGYHGHGLGKKLVGAAAGLAAQAGCRAIRLDVLEGNPQDLANPDVVFLSESGARSMFGSEDPLGKTVSYDIWGEEAVLLVKGIFRDVPLNTSLEKRPEAVVSFATIGRHTRWATGWNSGGNYNGFVRLRSGNDAAWLNERLTAAIARHLPPGSGLELSVHIRDAGVPSLYVGSPGMEAYIAGGAVCRGGLCAGHAAGGGGAILSSDRARPWLEPRPRGYRLPRAAGR